MRWRGWLIGQCLWIGVVAVLIPVVAGQDYRELDRRISEVDKDLSSRVRVLESDMTEVKWLARGVALAVIGQLVVTAFAFKERKP